MRKQYLLKVQFADDVTENRWWNGARLDPMAKPGQRFYDSLEDAKAALNRLMAKANQAHVYDKNGKRIETKSIGGGFTADLEIDRKVDEDNRIVNWSIKVREVTEWEAVESNH